MPTTLHRSRKGRRRALPDIRNLELETVVAVPKWEGYCPNLNHLLGDLQYAQDADNLIPRSGDLMVDSGFAYFDQNSLPLGVDGTTAEAPVSPTTDRQPVIGLFELIRQDNAVSKYLAGAATSLGIDAAATGTVAALFWFNGTTPDWEEVPFGGSGTQMASSRDNLYDWAFYPYGGTAIGGAAELPGIVVFTNNDDEVYAWDPGAGLGSTPPGEYDRLFSAFGAHPFYARSVELFDGRLVFLNTTEDTGGTLTSQQQRVRWTDIGAAAPSLTAVGAGFLDFEEFGDDGLRVLRFRDIAACYFRDGIGLIRRTGQATQPFVRQYVTKNRGLLGPFAVCRISDDVHFCICTDGWFLFNSSGEFQELGLDSQGHYKWKEEFYSELSTTYPDHIAISYDQLRHVVRVAWPRKNNSEDDFTINEVWVYDLQTDTVWPQSGYQVTCWGETSSIPGTPGTTIDQLSGTIDSLTGSIDSYSPNFQSRALTFADKDGYVYYLDPYTRTRLGNYPTWSYYSFRRQAGGDLYSYATAARVDIEFVRNLNAGDVTFEAFNDVGYADGKTASMDGVTGRVSQDYTFPHIAGKRLGVHLTGTGDPQIRSFALSTLPAPSDGRDAST